MFGPVGAEADHEAVWAASLQVSSIDWHRKPLAWQVLCLFFYTARLAGSA